MLPDQKKTAKNLGLFQLNMAPIVFSNALIYASFSQFGVFLCFGFVMSINKNHLKWQKVKNAMFLQQVNMFMVQAVQCQAFCCLYKLLLVSISL